MNATGLYPFNSASPSDSHSAWRKSLSNQDDELQSISLIAEQEMNDFSEPNDDYSSRLEDILGDDVGHEEDEEEAFVDDGHDAVGEEGESYAGRMQAIMGYDDSEQEVEGMLRDADHEPDFTYLRAEMDEVLPDRTMPSIADRPSPAPASNDPSPPSTPAVGLPQPQLPTPTKLRPAFLHPTVSRLRSFTPAHRPRMPSTSSMNSVNTLASLPNGASPAFSHFSDMSRSSSLVDLHDALDEKKSVTSSEVANPREAFRWTTLRTISTRIYPPSSAKPSAILGVTPSTSVPTALAANGLLCIGMSDGRTMVFDFRQQLKCICGVDATVKDAGSVTALCLSHDHTFLGIGHANGHIHLYDLSKPQVPARTVLPTTMAAVLSGRREGHLAGSPVTHLSFIGARHTALVSADATGLAFYHSLGKVLFIEASDVLRILGRYPDEVSGGQSSALANGSGASTPSQTPKSRILAMSALPIGPAPHPTESYNLIAIITPVKVIVVGLRPSPRTWYRRHRRNEGSEKTHSGHCGCIAWYPSIPEGADAKGQASENGASVSSKPVLAYSWGSSLALLRVSEDRPTISTVPGRMGKRVDEIGKIVFEEGARWTAEGDILALQWLNAKQLLVFTAGYLQVLDVASVQAIERAYLPADFVLANPVDFPPSADSRVSDGSACARVYKGKVFLLGKREIRAGTLLSWSDHILAFMQQGDFLAAIDLCRSYLTGEATGNKTGLPEDAAGLREVVGAKITELMTSSARYAFSEERMRDATHHAPDGRGVDRTYLFERLVSACAEACIALDDCDFLFSDLYERYQESGIDAIFLAQLEPFVLNGRIRAIPPHVSQRLIAVHDERGEYEQAEALIWHMDPQSLDINQAINMCRRQHLYDALIYVYTRCLKDFVTPLLDLLNVIHEISSRSDGRPHISQDHLPDATTDMLVSHAYKVYAYLADVLCGIAYPSNGEMAQDDASEAKTAVYTFLFFGRTSSLTASEESHLLLSHEENGEEPTYPYLRTLLQFDAEALLHALDLAFEDSYLNDAGQGVNRQVIINVLLEISISAALLPADLTFLNIFIARNAPKYPQFVQITPSTYDRILLELASDPDPSTTEDRQLAAEYLLSVHTPHDGDRLVEVFEQAGFYRILRSIYTQERKWPALTLTYLRDKEMQRDELFENLDRTLQAATRFSKGSLPEELQLMILDAIPRLIGSSVLQTAVLVDKHLPSQHTRVLRFTSERRDKQFTYLRCLLEPNLLGNDIEDGRGVPLAKRLDHIDIDARQLYISLMCEFGPTEIVRAVQALPSGFFDLASVISTCDERGIYDAEIWCMDRQGHTTLGFNKLESVMAKEAASLADECLDGANDEDGVYQPLLQLTRVTKMALRLCQDHVLRTYGDLSVEEIWFRLLHSEVNMVQTVSTALGAIEPQHQTSSPLDAILPDLRALVQETFLALISTPSSGSRALSFPALFKRLVETISAEHSSSTYSEFRTILSGMLAHYRGESDALVMVNRLVGQDLFGVVEEMTRKRKRGWRPAVGQCDVCGRLLDDPPNPQAAVRAVPLSSGAKAVTSGSHPVNGSAQANGFAEPTKSELDDLVVVFSGLVYHRRCFDSTSHNTFHA